jgi:WD40 repeat protein
MLNIHKNHLIHIGGNNGFDGSWLELLSLQLVNHVYFSPDGRWVASASFDKSVKLWDGYSGKFITTFRGHVGPVYQIRFDGLLFLSSLSLLRHNQTLIIM